MTTILLGKECSPFLEIDDSLLQRVEVRFVWAETSDAFVRLALEHLPDLIVLDPDVPGFDALACAAAIAAEPALTGAIVLFVGKRGAANGVARPVTQARLLDAMKKHGLATERGGDRVEVAIKVDFAKGETQGLAYTRDLAPDGCFLHTHDAFAAGESLTLTFQLPTPGGRELHVEGEVLRVEPPVVPGTVTSGIAVRFTGLALADRAELGKFLRQRRQGAA